MEKQEFSIASYVINFDELVDALKAYLENGVNVDIGSIVVPTDQMEDLLFQIKDKIQGVDYNASDTSKYRSLYHRIYCI